MQIKRPLAGAVSLISSFAIASNDAVCMIGRAGTPDAPSKGCLDYLAQKGGNWFVKRCDRRTFWTAGHNWKAAGDCSGGCQACLEGAIAYGADAAVCNRRSGLSFCSAGYSPLHLNGLRSADPCFAHDKQTWSWLDAGGVDNFGYWCKQGVTDMRADLRRPGFGNFDMERDRIEELKQFREGRGMAENRKHNGACARDCCKHDCNEGHIEDDPPLSYSKDERPRGPRGGRRGRGGRRPWRGPGMALAVNGTGSNATGSTVVNGDTDGGNVTTGSPLALTTVYY